MADYYPLISRAVAGLEKNNGENRRSMSARALLLAQLRGVTPALNSPTSCASAFPRGSIRSGGRSGGSSSSRRAAAPQVRAAESRPARPPDAAQRSRAPAPGNPSQDLAGQILPNRIGDPAVGRRRFAAWRCRRLQPLPRPREMLRGRAVRRRAGPAPVDSILTSRCRRAAARNHRRRRAIHAPPGGTSPPRPGLISNVAFGANESVVHPRAENPRGAYAADPARARGRALPRS
jgi:hypothetical protein